MDYVNLGRTGLKVSRICLGCMTYGKPPAPGEMKGGRHMWALNEEESQPFLRQALDLGINFFDTANVYSSGDQRTGGRQFSEGEHAARGCGDCNESHGVMRDEPNGEGLSRKAILYRARRESEAAWNGLRRPLSDSSLGLRDADRGDARGAARCGEGREGAVHWCVVDVCVAVCKGAVSRRLHGWTRFVTMQNHYNLLYREEEREMMPLCADEGIAVIPWSPLARGRLTRAWQSETTKRSETDRFGNTMYSRTEEDDERVVDRLGEIAAKRGVPRAQVALAWI